MRAFVLDSLGFLLFRERQSSRASDMSSVIVHTIRMTPVRTLLTVTLSQATMIWPSISPAAPRYGTPDADPAICKATAVVLANDFIAAGT